MEAVAAVLLPTVHLGDIGSTLLETSPLPSGGGLHPLVAGVHSKTAGARWYEFVFHNIQSF